MHPLKPVERAFRSLLLRILGFVARRGTRFPPQIDFHGCKFLFIRQDRIGDVLVSTPLFGALKRRYPNAIIDVLLSTNNHFVLNGEHLVRKRWVYTKRLFSSMKLLMGIRAERYDFVIDLMDNPSATSTVISLLAGGRWNVGIDKQNRYAYDIIVPMLSRRDTHIVDRLSQLLTVFGIDPASEDLRVRYVVSPESRRSVDVFLHKTSLGTHPLIGVNISAGSETRYWGTRRYQDLLRLLAGHLGSYALIVLYKPSDIDRAQEIVRAVPSAVMAPEGTFDEFAAIIQRLRVLITPDTSAVHLASAFQVPSVILYVQSNSDLRIWEPYKTPCEPIITSVDDLSTIPVEVVFDAVKRLLTRVGSVSEQNVSGIPGRV